MGAAALGAVDAGEDDRLGAIEQVLQLQGEEEVCVVDLALVIHRHLGVAPLQLLDLPALSLQPFGGAKDAHVLVHRDAQVPAHLRDAVAVLRTVQQRLQAQVLLIDDAVRHRRGARGASEGGGGDGGAPPEDHRIEQRVGPQPVAAVNADAGRLAGGVEAGQGGGAHDVGLDAAHGVVDAGPDRDRLLDDVDVDEVDADLADLPQPFVDQLLVQVAHVQQDAAFHPAAFVDLRLFGARDDVAAGQLHHVRGVTLQEAVALGVEEVGALAARALSDENAAAFQGGGVVLDHLHIHERGAGAPGLADAIACADEGVGAGLVHAAEAAGGDDGALGEDGVELAGADLQRQGAVALAAVGDEGGDEPLFIDPKGGLAAPFRLHELLVHHVEDRLAGDVAHEVGAGLGGAAEHARAQPAALLSVEDDPHALQGDQLRARLLAEDLDAVLVGQVVAALDRVEGVLFPGVLFVEGRVDAALGGVGVAAHGVDFGDHPDVGALLLGSEGGTHPSQAGADDQHVMLEDGHGVLPGRRPFEIDRCRPSIEGAIKREVGARGFRAFRPRDSLAEHL